MGTIVDTSKFAVHACLSSDSLVDAVIQLCLTTGFD